MKQVLAALVLVVMAASAQADDRPVVVELFTSQGCSSCPPADSFLGELAERSDVLALSMHVDYWNYIGWQDPFSKAQFTKRQQVYARMLGERSVYTPQMVIDGRYEGVGSRREMIERLITKAKDHMQTIPVQLSRSGDQLDIRVGRDDLHPTVMESIYLLMIDRRHQTEIKRGENTGRVIDNFNVVRGMRHVGYWKGGALELTISLAGVNGEAEGDMAAVLVQRKDSGQIIGAQVIALR